MEEAGKSQLPKLKQLEEVLETLEKALEKEKTERLALQSLLRQEMADSMRQERDQRQGLHEMLLKEQLERTQAMADVKTALVHEGSERANSIGELRTELQASDKGVANLRLETQEKVNAVRESVTALDTKILSVEHEAQNRENKLSERLQAVDGNTRDLLGQLQQHETATKARMEGISKSFASNSSEMDSRLSALQQGLTLSLLCLALSLISLSRAPSLSRPLLSLVLALSRARAPSPSPSPFPYLSDVSLFLSQSALNSLCTIFMHIGLYMHTTLIH